MPPFPLNPRGVGERTLFVQVPCHNEAETLPITLAALPRSVEGYAHVRWLVIDDGSTDGTHEVALRCGADYALRLTHPSRSGVWLHGRARCRSSARRRHHRQH